MRILAVILTSGLFLGGVPAMADKTAWPCASYASTCKDDAAVKAATDKQAHYTAMHKCTKKAAVADAANGKQCLAWMESHHDHATHNGGDTEKE